MWLLFFLLAGCSSIQLASSKPKQLLLLPPGGGPPPVLLKQVVNFERGDIRHEFMQVMRLQPDQIRLVALLASGQKLLTLSYDGDHFEQQQHLQQAIPGREILALVQLVHWPQAVVQQYYRLSEGWRLHNSPQQRQLSDENGLVVGISYQGDRVVVEHYTQRYRVSIQTLESTELVN